MRRNLIVAAGALVVLARPSLGQVSTTNCQFIGNQVRCNTQQGVIQLPGWGNDVGKNLGNLVSQAMIARRQAQARQGYTQALQEAQALSANMSETPIHPEFSVRG
ncbi:hypothetical protein [Gemmatimonas sp.]|uniref:hypothetical protein n=1 Tax=Gemmatimonas sp. TaxID=1962908 RepID=UPI0039836245